MNPYEKWMMGAERSMPASDLTRIYAGGQGETVYPEYMPIDTRNIDLRRNQFEQPPPVKAQNKAAKNAYADKLAQSPRSYVSEDVYGDEAYGSRNPSNKQEWNRGVGRERNYFGQILKNMNGYVGDTNIEATNGGMSGEKYFSPKLPKNNPESGSVIQRLAGPTGKLPAMAGFLGGAQGVASGADLLSEVMHTKDPVAAYRNWLGMGNQYE